MFLSAIDGIVLNLQLKDHIPLNVKGYKLTLSRDHLTTQSGRDQPISGYLGCALKNHAITLLQYQPYPLVHQGDQNWLFGQSPCLVHESHLLKLYAQPSSFSRSF